MSQLINEEELKEWSGYKTRPTLIKWLDEHNITWWDGKDKRICVTLNSIEEQQKRGVISFGAKTERE